MVLLGLFYNYKSNAKEVHLLLSLLFSLSFYQLEYYFRDAELGVKNLLVRKLGIANSCKTKITLAIRLIIVTCISTTFLTRLFESTSCRVTGCSNQSRSQSISVKSR